MESNIVQYENYIKENIDSCDHLFEKPLTKAEIIEALKSLKNNKSASFDMITNDPIFLLFKTMIECSIYPTSWKVDILSPIHKKGVKDDPNNFRGIAVSSHFGKLFNTI